MSLAEELKNRTSEMHRHAETRPFQKALVSGKVTREQLALYLAQLGLIHQTLESLLDSRPHGHLEQLADCSCDHSHHLAADIQALEGVTKILPETERLAGQLREHAQGAPLFLLGALYVLEGSMNGNRFIARGLAASLGLTPGEPGLSYWDPYGEDQRPRWAAFRAEMDALAMTDAEREAVCHGADFMFAAIAEISDAVARETQLTPSN